MLLKLSSLMDLHKSLEFLKSFCKSSDIVEVCANKNLHLLMVKVTKSNHNILIHLDALVSEGGSLCCPLGELNLKTKNLGSYLYLPDLGPETPLPDLGAEVFSLDSDNFIEGIKKSRDKGQVRALILDSGYGILTSSGKSVEVTWAKKPEDKVPLSLFATKTLLKYHKIFGPTNSLARGYVKGLILGNLIIWRN